MHVWYRLVHPNDVETHAVLGYNETTKYGVG